MDTVFRGFIAGLLATVVYSAVDWLLFVVNLTPFTVVHYGAVLITPPLTELTIVSLALGLVAVSIAGSFVGVLISAMILFTGVEYIYIKCLGFILVLWIVHVSLLPRVVEPELFSVLPLVVIVVNLLIKFVWGVTYTFVFQKVNG